ncbi:acetyltransferase [Pseudochryseolinea flava]|uniref:Acetyltransferase n=1 Tax=Pseudochryseolinea flava TaxID=2059302 RepID=A0A364Y321_9BACT|nr:acetyltransferase [Pseudochryseolinea flava]RAW01285.1 acetyltransferase [Pseudochryseolinea flava]
MKKSLIIFGAGGLGREVKTIVDVLPEWNVSGFCDDHVPVGTTVMGAPILGDTKYLETLKAASVVVAIGNPLIKRDIVNKIKQNTNIEFVTIIHPRAVLCDASTIDVGRGTIITAGSILTTSIRVGQHVLINLNATVGHDAVIGDFTSVMPGVNIAGQVEIASAVMIGSGANILNRIRIGDDAVVGSGAVVLENVLPGKTVVGVPAKSILKK